MTGEQDTEIDTALVGTMTQPSDALAIIREEIDAAFADFANGSKVGFGCTVNIIDAVLTGAGYPPVQRRLT